MAFSLVHQIHEPPFSQGTPPPLLLLLHGLGSNEQDLIGLASRLDPRFFCVSARAPYALDEKAKAWPTYRLG
jgi:phospholipase/carboxylesterase